jgi:hypothetical protein
MPKKLTELNVHRAFEYSASNPYMSVNDFASHEEDGEIWILGDDKRMWYARLEKQKIVFHEYVNPALTQVLQIRDLNTQKALDNRSQKK